MSINFTINSRIYTVRLDDHPPDISLNTFIRDYVRLSGTKFMCLEGGCGACVVTIRRRHPITRNYHGWAANSCLTLLKSCDSWDIITIEGLGNKTVGYHPIQERLAHMSGSQCGYCSPGMVMNMYGLLEAKGGNVTASEIENSFGGNLCRCTGYRPILDAMKSFATDSEYEYIDLCKDIEDLGRVCPRMGKICPEICKKTKTNKNYAAGNQWYYPKNLQELFSALNDIRDGYILVGGSTGHGVYRRDESIVNFIDINYVPELHINAIGDNLEIGGGITITETIDILTQSSSHVGFEYCSKLVEHLNKVATVPVRNMGTIAGNLMLKHDHNEFPSDIYLILSTIKASIHVARNPDQIIVLSMSAFLSFNMYKTVILKISLPPINSDNFFFETYKIAPRAQNAHAYVNAGFYVRVEQRLITDVNLCFGGINPSFTQAGATSRFLLGKIWITNDILEQAIQILSTEIRPDWVLPDTSPEYRKLLACGLFYKFVLRFAPTNQVSSKYQSGGYILTRPLSSGTQSYETKRENWPLTQPVVKLDAQNQCAGEALYSNDVPPIKGQLWAAFVVATETSTTIVQIDPADALLIPGVVAFYSAKDIPGKNSFVTIGAFQIVEDEEIFCSGKVNYHSQPVGVIVAETLDLAKLAANKVKILYERIQNPVLCTLKDVLNANIADTKHRFKDGPCTKSQSNNLKATVNIKGNFEMGSQYHFTMEPQTTICFPEEDEITIHSASQYVDMFQTAISSALKMNESKINFVVRRLGGSYGSKITRGSQVAVACALACTKLRRPIRFVLSLESNMATMGKRMACMSDYNVDFDSTGLLQRVEINYFTDFGCTLNDNPMDFFTNNFIFNCYRKNGWTVKGKAVITDATSHTWCRAPGSSEAIGMIENIMEHIARKVNRDPVDVRMDNIPNDSKMKELLPEFIRSTSYRDRKTEINKFNSENRWRKKGIAISLMRFPADYFGVYPVTVVIYQYDGTVAISHGGIDVGQGLNTKVAQVAAYTLGIPLSMISIKPMTNINGGNVFPTGGSVASECLCLSVKGACEILLKRMLVAKITLTNPTWVAITRLCYELNISLIANHLPKPGELIGYNIWGLACTEVEVDILTGSFQLNRVDILEDTAESMNPFIDIGQVEGAFVLGLGYWLYEVLTYNRSNGELLTNRTWNYKVPGAKDIPADFRVTLYQKEPNKTGFLRSKATGEPALCLAVSASFALRHALDSARNDLNINDWYQIGAPITPETVLYLAGHNTTNFTLT